MQSYIIYIIPPGLFFLGLILSFLFTKLKYEKRSAALEEKIKGLSEEKIMNQFQQKELESRIETERKDRELLAISLSEKQSELLFFKQRLNEEKEEMIKLQERFSSEFENLANKILEEKTQKYTQTNKENMKLILDPLKEKINTFEKKVEDIHRDSIDRQSALKEQILGLQKLNEKMSSDAINLTKALKGDSKKQGDWGEFQLETILEKAGLVKDIHFSSQSGFKDDVGFLKKPDFIINLPDKKHLIIDAKVSLTGYERYYNSTDPEEEQAGLKDHIISLKNHIKELNTKKYNELYEISSPDFVLMFVPIEPALMVALQKDHNLFLDALHKNIVLVSTSTLLATLSTVATIWRQEDQKQNVLEIARQAGNLYDKFEGFLQDLLKIGHQLNASQTSYTSALNKLSEGKGNILGRIEKLKVLGAKTQKELPETMVKKALHDLN